MSCDQTEDVDVMVGIGIALIAIYVVALILVSKLRSIEEQKGSAMFSAMFDECKTVEEVAKRGPIELLEMNKMLNDLGKAGDLMVAKKLATERMMCASNEEAVERVRRKMGGIGSRPGIGRMIRFVD